MARTTRKAKAPPVLLNATSRTKKAPPKTRCSCGCRKLVTAKTEGRHLRAKDPPFLARVAKALKERATKAAKATATAFQEIKERLTPVMNHHPAQFSPPTHLDAEDVVMGSPISQQLLQDPVIEPQPSAGSSNKSTVTNPLETWQKERIRRSAWVEDYPEDDEGRDGEGDDDEGFIYEDWEEEENGGGDADGDIDGGEDKEEAASPVTDADGIPLRTSNEEFERMISEHLLELSEDDEALLRAYSYKLKHNITDAAFDDLRFLSPGYALPKWKKARRYINLLTRFTQTIYDCCVKSCIAYIGVYAELEQCPYCQEPRYNSNGNPRRLYKYIPIPERLKALYANPDMARLMNHRHEESCRANPNNDIEDYYDGARYKHLVEKTVELCGEVLDHKFFEDATDIALGIATDGFAPFRKRTQTCWPILIYNLNLPSDIRFHLKHLICVGVIPGPEKPKDFDSFLYPLVEDLFELAAGVEAYHAIRQETFLLKAYPMFGSGDMPAVSMMMSMKGHNGIFPCRMCEIEGVLKPGTTTYYVPLRRPRGFPPAADGTINYDPAKLPLRTHDNFLSQGRAVQNAPTQVEAETLAKACGIKGVPILSHVPSLSFPHSFPLDFMHLGYENTLKNYVNFLSGDFKDLKHDGEGYRIEKKTWEAIGAATAKSGDTIPSAFAARPRNLSDDRKGVTADMYSTWALWNGPVYLRDAFPERKFYVHYLQLVELINLCLKFTITQEDLAAIRSGFIEWVVTYEKLFYQYQADRLSACPLTIHSLLHIADGIEQMGPPWVYWAFPMERFCGKLARTIKSRRFPFANLDNQVLGQAQLSYLITLHDLDDRVTLRIPRKKMEYEIPNPSHEKYTRYRLGYPRKPFDLTSVRGLQKAVAAALVTRFSPDNPSEAGGITMNDALYILNNSTVEQWGKLKRLEGGDTMLASEILKASSNCDDRRDATFVRYKLAVDLNARFKNKPTKYRTNIFYGQLTYILAISMPAVEGIPELSQPTTMVLGVVNKCHVTSRLSPKLNIHFYRKAQGTDVTDITNIKCLIGRIPWNKEWAICDRSQVRTNIPEYDD